MYFSKFPQLLYSLDGGKSVQLVTDILRRTEFIQDFISNGAVYDEYDVQDGDTPEILSDKFYGNPFSHWIIMIANNIVDPILDWPMSQSQLYSYCVSKYTEELVYSIHHYEDADGVVINENESAYPVSNYEYEERVNNNKRRIKVIRKELIADITREFASLIKK